MRYFAFALAWFATVVLLAACARTSPGGAESGGIDLAGDWIGGFDAGKEWIYLQAHFRQQGGEVTGTFDLPLEFVSGRALERVRSQSGSVAFEIPRHPSAWLFDGRVEGRELSGLVEHEGGRAPFRLHRIETADTAPFTGTYRLTDGRMVHFRRWTELGINGLLSFDFTTGRLRALFPSSPTTFFCGPSLLVTDPVESFVSFTSTSEITWNSAATSVTGKRVPLREADVNFNNGDVNLSGTLVMPETGARHPAVVIAPGGTAAGTRDMGRHFADFLALNGVAVLLFDKRGTGASGGDWRNSGFEDLAGDVLAGVEALQKRDDIDPRKIGLLGFSQGGWVVALAASKSPEVAFIISQSGPGVTPLEQESYRVEQWLIADGFSQEQVRAATDLVRFRYECARLDQGWERLAELQNQSKGQPWYPYVGDSSGRDDPFWGFWRRIRDFDPVPVLAKVRCPVLALFGDKDTYLPAEKSAAIWKQTLERAGNNDATITVFRGADHSLLEAWTGGLKESPRKKQFVPEYLPTLGEWVLKRVR
jgi:pimeloyl-ACP methyl ester carboxylesterase